MKSGSPVGLHMTYFQNRPTETQWYKEVSLATTAVRSCVVVPHKLLTFESRFLEVASFPMTILRRIVVVFCVFLGVAWNSALADQITYTKNSSLPPMRITYEQLQSVLDKSAALIATANASSKINSSEERLKLEHGESEVEIGGHRLQGSSASIPKLATTLTYTMTVYPRNKMPVSTVSLLFHDFDRTITVTGQSPEQVDAIFASLKSDFLSYSTQLGGFGFRNWTSILLFFILLSGGSYFLYAIFNTRKLRLIFPILVCCSFLFLLFYLPFDEILAGFSVSKYDPSLLKRYEAELTILGTLVGLTALPLSYFLPKK